MSSIKDLINNLEVQYTPMAELSEFLKMENEYDELKEYDRSKFVGYTLDIDYEQVKVITSDNYKVNVGGIPRGSYLIMVPANYKGIELHYTLLRVNSVSSTPLSSQMQQTYFEMQKRSMPDIDIWTKSELQWGALECDLLGMFHIDSDTRKLMFSGDINNIVSPHKYLVYKPNKKLLNQIVNGMLDGNTLASIGHLRTMECKLGIKNKKEKIDVQINIDDFKGTRTAMFGKTRLGKSNVVKLIAKNTLDSTLDKSVGQLIFDLNGEYANNNPQDGGSCLRAEYEERSTVYALTKRAGTTSKMLRINFFEHPATCMTILRSLLEKDNQTSNYIKSFYSVELPPLDTIKSFDRGDKTRAVRKIIFYWLILHSAGFGCDENALSTLLRDIGYNKGINLDIKSDLRVASGCDGEKPSTLIGNLDEIKKVKRYYDNNKSSKLFESTGKKYFDQDDEALLEFLSPKTGTGPSILRAYKQYHSKDASDFLKSIKNELDQGKLVILDLGNASDEIRSYFSDMISKSIFNHQEKKFVENRLGNHYVQLYFEEAHNIFPTGDKDFKNFYARFAKEGAKFHIGMVYSTQSPSTISKELLAQTENFFIGHVSSSDEVKSLVRMQIAFEGVQQDIMRSKTPGYMRMMTRSHRFVIPFQAFLFKDLIGGGNAI